MAYYKYQSDDSVNKWIQEVSKGRSHIPLELETSLISIYQTAEGKNEKTEALNTLLSYNASSIASIVLSVYHSTRGAENIELQDLLQEAITIFIRKVERFKHDKGARLITYYTRDIRTSIQRYIASNAMNIRQGSVYLQSIATQISVLKRELDTGDDVQLTQNQIAERLGISTKTIAMVEQFTGVIVTDLKDTMSHPSDSIGDDSSISAHNLFKTLNAKLSCLSKEQFKVVHNCLVNGENIPTEILDLIK